MRVRFRKSTENIIYFILLGTIVVSLLLLILMPLSTNVAGNQYVSDRIIIGLFALIYICLTGILAYRKHTKLAAWMVVFLYTLVGVFVLHIWGINAPVGILILGFVILLGGTLLGAKYIMGITTVIILILILIQASHATGIHSPDRSILGNPSTLGDIASYSVVFGIFALIAWLSGKKTEKTLARAILAENELSRERDNLAFRVDEQTRHLKEAQQKELGHLYKFAEVGQLTTIILHELANYLSILMLDIDDIKERHQNSVAIEHAKESIFYIDSIIDQVRNQIRDSDDAKTFDVLPVIQEAINQLRRKIPNVNIKLFVDPSSAKRLVIFGDPLRLSQAITILVTNAAQANSNPRSEISIRLNATISKTIVSVKDFGTGISPDARKQLFCPKKSHKNAGLGIGLFITQQIIETHFKGKISLDPTTAYTEFHMEIPRFQQ